MVVLVFGSQFFHDSQVLGHGLLELWVIVGAGNGNAPEEARLEEFVVRHALAAIGVVGFLQQQRVVRVDLSGYPSNLVAEQGRWG